MMAKNNLTLILEIILLFCLIVFSIQEKHQGSDEILEINYEQGALEYEVEKSKKNQRFRVEFKSIIPFYVNVELTVTGDFPTPLLCFSSSDANCDTPEQIVKNPNDKTVTMWIKREQFEGDDKHLYVKAICQDEGVDYTLKIQGGQAAQFGPNFVYSYYVGSYNREMLFEIIGNGDTGTLVAAVEGSKSPTINMEAGSVAPFPTGQISYASIFESTNKTLTKITVKGAVDDYITLSLRLTDTDSYSEILQPNGPEVTGFILAETLKSDCYKITTFTTTYKAKSKFYLTGRMHSIYGMVYLKDENGKVIDSSEEEITNGHISRIIESEGKAKQICIGFPKRSNIKAYILYYSLSLSEPTSLISLYNYYPPQIPGQIYRRYLPKDKIAFFSPMALDSSSKKYNYNVFTVIGNAKMAITKCTTYPNCQYSNLNGLTVPKSTNQMTIWTTEEDISSTIGREKNVIVVQCLDDDNENNGYCLFETSVFKKGETINLVPNEKLSYYAVKEEKGYFKLNIGEEVTLQELKVDIMIFSGDVSFNLKESDSNEFSYHKYYLSNKVYFQFDLTNSKFTEFNIEYSASLNSFFTIQYNFDIEANVLEEYMQSGENYLVQIDPTVSPRKKTIHLQNLSYKNQKPFLANFFALNCEFEVKRNNDLIEFFDGYAQEVLTPSTTGYKSEYYDYSITITEPDLSNYNHKQCMLYVGGIESDNDYKKEIIVGENINQQIIFENGFSKVRFLYPQADNRKDLAIYANIIDQGIYQITVYLNNKNEVFKRYTVTRTQIFYIAGLEISDTCKENELCAVIVEVELVNELVKTNPMIEITIRQIKNVPSYIQKGIAKRDFTCGDNFYYLYTDIGKNEVGEVLVDFLRDFGDLWGKIVRKDQTSPEEEANWRGIYRMPSEDWEDSLEYNRYIKKLLVRTEDTQDCIEGCYLLISIRISQIGEYVDDSKFYPFSILTRITPNNRAYTDIPKVVIQVDEYIIGNVDISTNDRIYEFYEIWLPHDATRLDFDWQSGVAGLYINVGGIRPTTKNSHFKLLPPGKDSILSLTKDEILKKAKENKITPPYTNSIQDLNFVIGVWTDKTSSLDTEIYSLRVHEVNDNDNKLDIIEVKADKKIICKPHYLSENQYRCLFMVTYDSDDTIKYTPFFGHASSVDASSFTYMYASFVDRKLYDELDNEGLNRAIPTLQTATYNSKDDGVDYIYINNLDQKKYLFINVIADSPEDVMLLTNMPLYNYISYDIFEFYPTPGKEQLLSVAGDQLRLQFATEKSILVNIVTLTGEAEIYWRSDPTTIYSLRGRGDRLTLSSGTASDHLVLRKRQNEFNNNKLKTMEDPGFLFYISYYLKDEQNFDEVIYGRSLEFAYKDTDLPVILYSKIGNFSSDINVAVTFKDSQFDNTGEYALAPLEVRASLIKENTIYKAKKDKDLAPSVDRLTLGSYDTALKTAQVMLSKEIISTYNLKTTDNPSLYLSIDKNKFITDKTYEKFSVEVQFSKANEGIIPTEKVYHYGSLGDQSRLTFYKLRIDKQKPLMRIQISFNSNYVNFYISETFSWQQKNSTEFMEAIKARGKIIVTLSTEKINKECLYLIFFKTNNNDNINNHLFNYVFKYINSKTTEDFVDYKIVENEEIVIKENYNNKNPKLSTIECTFNKLDIDWGKANITYFFKVVYADAYYQGEISDTIAVTESPYYSVYARNPEDNNGLITLTAKGDHSRWTILQVIAQIQQETILEYVAYKGKYTYRAPQNQGNDESSSVNPTLFYVVGGILLVLVIGLIIAIVIFKIKNQELVEQVKHVSFQKTNSTNINSSSVDPNNLIQNS
jgi:hypothetical protein